MQENVGARIKGNRLIVETVPHHYRADSPSCQSSLAILAGTQPPQTVVKSQSGEHVFQALAADTGNA